ncbi:MAG: N-acetylmuramoyl-L-alanine amidase [Clostridia bacterium]|nr:N-acetylmuramoyl-L-alanine amidase [Clostridia bacterium]
MKKLSFIAIKKKSLLIFLVAFLCVCLFSVGIYYTSKSVSVPITEYVVVIDAGHGGIDGGVVGASGESKESDINLAYSLCLGAYFEGLNFKVVYTRQDDNGLYSEFATNKKVDDMKKREQIINSAKPDLVISMHQNGFTLPDQRGITAFYKIGHEESKALADCIQERFQKKIEYARAEALPGDYFILNCTNTLSVLIECGFLTNPDEEVLLQDVDYMNKVCHEIFSACVMYFIDSHKLTY